MPDIWNTIGSFVDSLTDPEEDARKRAAFQVPQQPDQPQGSPTSTTEPDVTASMAAAVSPGHRKMFSFSQPNTPIPEAGGWLKSETAPPITDASQIPPSDATRPRIVETPTDNANANVGTGMTRPDPTNAPGLSSANSPTTRLQDLEQGYRDLSDAPIIHPGLHTEIDKYGNPVQKQSKAGWLGRLGAGAGDAALGWLKSGGRGGLPGLATKALGEGIDEAVHPDVPQERKKQRQLQKMWNDISAESQLQGVQSKQQIDAAKLYNDQLTGALKIPEYQIKREAENRQQQSEKLKEQVQNRPIDVKHGTKWFKKDPNTGEETPKLNAEGNQITDDLPKQHVTMPDGTLKTFDPGTGKYTDEGNFAKLVPEKTTDGWQKTVTTNTAKRAKIQGDEDAANLMSKNLTATNNVLRSELEKYPPDQYGERPEAKQIKAKIAANDAANLKALSQAQAARTAREGIVDPSNPVGTYSEKDFTTRAKAKGLTGNALKAAIAKAKADKIIQ